MVLNSINQVGVVGLFNYVGPMYCKTDAQDIFVSSQWQQWKLLIIPLKHADMLGSVPHGRT